MSVGRSVGRSVRRSVGPLFFRTENMNVFRLRMSIFDKRILYIKVLADFQHCAIICNIACMHAFFFERGKNAKMNKKLKGEGRGGEGEGERKGERGRRGEGRGGKEKKSEDASLVCLPNLFLNNGGKIEFFFTLKKLPRTINHH